MKSRTGCNPIALKNLCQSPTINFNPGNKTEVQGANQSQVQCYVSGQKTQRAKLSGSWHGKQQQEEMRIGKNEGENPAPAKSTLVEGHGPAPRGCLLRGATARLPSSHYGLRQSCCPSADSNVRPEQPRDAPASRVPASPK